MVNHNINLCFRRFKESLAGCESQNRVKKESLWVQASGTGGVGPKMQESGLSGPTFKVPFQLYFYLF